MNSNNTKTNTTPHYDTWGRRDQLIVGTFLQSIAWFLSLAVYSYVMVMPSELVFEKKLALCDMLENWMGIIGCHVAHYLVDDLSGIMAFLFPLFPFWLSMCLFFRKSVFTALKGLATILFITIWSTMAVSCLLYTSPSPRDA